MPYKRRYKRQRKYGRRYRRRNNRYTVSVSRRSPIARQLYTKVRYVEQIQLDPSAGLMAQNAFSANGLYDPNITGTGHQPLGFDQLMALYDHYEVISSKCTVTFSPTTLTGQSIVGGITLDDSGTMSPASAEAAQEQAESAWRTITPQQTAVVKRAVNISKFLGKPRGTDGLIGSVAGNPGEDLNYVVWVASPNSNDNPGIANATVMIEYWVKFSEPKELQQS